MAGPAGGPGPGWAAWGFRDEGDTAEVRVPLRGAVPAGAGTAGVDVRATAGTLAVGLPGGAAGPAPACALYGRIKPGETIWELDRAADELVVTLAKVEEEQRWPALAAAPEAPEAAEELELEGPEVATTPADVADLLAAARAGDAAALRGVPGARRLLEGHLASCIDEDGRNPLHLAALAGHADLTAALAAEYALDLDALDFDGHSALMLAAAGVHTAAAAALLAAGARVATPDGVHSAAHSAALHGRLGCLEALLEAAGGADAANAKGCTLLMAAASGGQAAALAFLVGRGADPTAVMDGGCTALHVAASRNDAACVDALLASGADPEARDVDGLAPVHAAAVTEGRDALARLVPVTGPLPGVEWTVEGLLRDARARDGYVRDVDQVGADATGPSTRRIFSAEAARELGELRERGRAAIKGKAFAAAVAAYARALEIDRDDATLWANRSLAHLLAGAGEAALRDADQARRRRPAWCKGWYRRGAALRALERWEAACEAFGEGLKVAAGGGERKELLAALRDCEGMARQAACY